jgi:TatD DNase family protein
MSALVDYHVHLDLFQDHVKMLRQSESEGVEIFTMTTTPWAWERNTALAKDLKHVRVGLGLHPQLVAQRFSEIEIFEKFAGSTNYIGEVGLDAGPRFYKSLDLQREVFCRILRASRSAGPKIMSIHSVRSAGKVMDCIENEIRGPKKIGLVFHWFTGSKSEAQRATEMGCYFSVNPMMLRAEGARKILKSLPLNRLLTETDGPFTEKTPGCPYLPKDLQETLQGIAELFGSDTEAMRRQVASNLASLEVILQKSTGPLFIPPPQVTSPRTP